MFFLFSYWHFRYITFISSWNIAHLFGRKIEGLIPVITKVADSYILKILDVEQIYILSQFIIGEIHM